MIIQEIDFLSKRYFALVISVIFMLTALASLTFKGLNPGIDFTGGFSVEVSYQEPPAINEIRIELASGGFPEAIVQSFGSPKDINIRIMPRENIDNKAIGNQIEEILNNSANPVQLRGSEFVSPQVGEELTEQGGLAMLFALIMIMIYIIFRFQWKFAIGAVLALIHDVLITIGIFSLFQISFDLAVLAAILAVVGYSLNDTIVVFDRIRENFRLIRKGNTIDITNQSINQTISRTLITSGTTLLVLMALYIIGGKSLEGFALALIIGVIIGTYSSIFVATTSVLFLDVSTTDLIPVKKETIDDGMP
ncbi:MAG: protein translocase subunit SecF [Gammaproteobacteria bacterium]|nr:protein translocase subunit SecF [Gammaproteobacteria bacterium]|tara:strand:+ start:1100 stop:2020 length:921 start_codon:yes stop_codon:yes gene_type:complete